MAKSDKEKPNFSLKVDKNDSLSENQISPNKDQLISPEPENKPTSLTKNEIEEVILKNPIANPIWLSVSEAAKISGVNTKTIRRAIQSGKIKYIINKDRYQVGLKSLILYLNTNTKLKNKLMFNGIGQYIKGWRK